MRRILSLWAVSVFLFVSNAYAAEVKDISVKQLEEELDNPKVARLFYLFTSWCSVCRQTIPNAVDVAQSYQGDKFKMVFISLDDGNNPMVQSIADQDVEVWRVKQQSPIEVVRAFNKAGIRFQGSIPHISLIDAKGKILVDGGYDVRMLKPIIEELISE
jgi:thiol-disulfide isomerase/thioredoxin